MNPLLNKMWCYGFCWRDSQMQFLQCLKQQLRIIIQCCYNDLEAHGTQLRRFYFTCQSLQNKLNKWRYALKRNQAIVEITVLLKLLHQISMNQQKCYFRKQRYGKFLTISQMIFQNYIEHIHTVYIRTQGSHVGSAWTKSHWAWILLVFQFRLPTLIP
jgi:hypothetical protein